MTPGRPVTFVVTEAFLDHFGLESARDLPGLKELRQAGLLDNRPLPGSCRGDERRTSEEARLTCRMRLQYGAVSRTDQRHAECFDSFRPWP